MTPDLVWLLLGGLTIAALMAWLFTTRARFRPPATFTPHCVRCGYQLSDRRPTCSECGRDLGGRTIVSDGWVPPFRRLCRVIVVFGVFAIAASIMPAVQAVIPFAGISRHVRTEFHRLDASRTLVPMLTVEERSRWFATRPRTKDHPSMPWSGGPT